MGVRSCAGGSPERAGSGAMPTGDMAMVREAGSDAVWLEWCE